jgi:hypothetical protein
MFYVLSTVHLGIILVNDQLDAQFFFLISLFQSSTYSEQPRAHHQENQLYQYNFWYTSLCVGDRLVCRSGRSCIPDVDVYQMLYWYNWFSWWSARGCSKHVENCNKHIRKKNRASSWSFTRIKHLFLFNSSTSISAAWFFLFRNL